MSRSRIEVRFREATFPAFTSQTSYWLNYKQLAEDNVREFRARPTLTIADRGPAWVETHLNLYFDPKKFCLQTYGLPYGDTVLEDAVRALFAEIFPSDLEIDPRYTEQGMQGEDFVSMDLSSAASRRLLDLDELTLTRILSHAAIETWSRT